MDISSDKRDRTWTRLRKRKLKRETESLLISAQNNANRTNHIKIYNTQCIDETINHIENECSKLTQKEYETKQDWMVKVIHWELCKKFQFDHNATWCIHKPELCERMRPVKSSGTSSYKQITWSWSGHQTKW